MQRGTLRNVVWWTLIITGVLIGGLIVDQIPNWQLPRVKTAYSQIKVRLFVFIAIAVVSAQGVEY